MENTITITKTFSAPVAKVWQAWTDPALFIKWFGPGESSANAKTYEVREGVAYEVDVVEPNGAIHTTTGVFEQVVPEARLVFTWLIADLPMDTSRITVTFQSVGEETVVTLEQENLSVDHQEIHRLGWTSAFTKLAGLLA